MQTELTFFAWMKPKHWKWGPWNINRDPKLAAGRNALQNMFFPIRREYLSHIHIIPYLLISELTTQSGTFLDLLTNFYFFPNRWRLQYFMVILSGFSHLLRILQILLRRSWLVFLPEGLPQEGQGNPLLSLCFSSWCLVRLPFCLKDFSHWEQLKVLKKGEWWRFKWSFWFLSRVKDLSHCPHFHPFCLAAAWVSSTWRSIFTTLLNCLPQWLQEWVFLAGSLLGFVTGILCTSLMCLLSLLRDMTLWHLPHLTTAGNSGLPCSLLRCTMNFLKSLKSLPHSWQLMAFPWAFSWWYFNDVVLEKTLSHRQRKPFSRAFLCTMFSWCLLEPLVVNNLLQNWHDKFERSWVSSSFGESSFSSLRSLSSPPAPFSSLSCSSLSSRLELFLLFFSISSTALPTMCSTTSLMASFLLWIRLLQLITFSGFRSRSVKSSCSFKSSCQGPSGFSKQRYIFLV